MKRILTILVVMAMIFVSPAFGAWDSALPAGTSDPSDIDTEVGANNTALQSLLDDLAGWADLQVDRTNATTVAVTADQLVLRGSSDLAARFETVSESIAITTDGASGLDTGAEQASKWYYVWIIAKDDGTINGLLSLSATAPTMPANYNDKALVSAVYNDSSSNFVDFLQSSHHYEYNTWRSMASGVAAAWESVDTANFVPSELSNVAFGSLIGFCGNIQVTNNNSVAADGNTIAPNKIIVAISDTGGAYWRLHLLTADTLYWSGWASANLYCGGFEITKLS